MVGDPFLFSFLLFIFLYLFNMGYFMWFEVSLINSCIFCYKILWQGKTRDHRNVCYDLWWSHEKKNHTETGLSTSCNLGFVFVI